MIPILPADNPGVREGARMLSQSLRFILKDPSHAQASGSALTQTAVINFLGKADPETIRTYAPRLYKAIKDHDDSAETP